MRLSKFLNTNKFLNTQLLNVSSLSPTMKPKSQAVSEPEFFTYQGDGTVLTAITPEQGGRIRFKGSDWPAQLSPQMLNMAAEKILAGMKVQVVGREGITLLVSSV